MAGLQSLRQTGNTEFSVGGEGHPFGWSDSAKPVNRWGGKAILLFSVTEEVGSIPVLRFGLEEPAPCRYIGGFFE